MNLIRTLLVDDNPDFLKSAAGFLSTVSGLEVVGQAMSGEEALKQVGVWHPDLVLMDVQMKGIGGLEALRRIQQMERPPRVILVTIHVDPEYRARAKKNGAAGFISKRRIGEELLPMIRKIFNR